MAPSAQEAPVLSVTSACVCYGAVRALSGVSITVPRGACVTVIGPNGAGKSTLLRAIMGLVPVSEGMVSFNGRDIGRLATEERARLGIALVPEGRGLLGSLTVEENLLVGGYVRRDALSDDLRFIYGFLPALKPLRERRAQFLSGGELQLLAIGRALMSRPALILLDEPSMGLSPKARESVLAALSALKARGISMLLIEQSVYLALKLADSLYKLDIGKVAFEGTPRDLEQADSLQAVYFGGG